MATQEEITQLLIHLSEGDQEALGELMPLVYDGLQRLARYHLRGERADHTLNTTALVHEAYLKLVDQDRVEWQNRSHFFGVASLAMRRILVNYAKKRSRLKRGGGAVQLSLDDSVQIEWVMTEARAAEIVALDDALAHLEKVSERAARVVECRYFGGLTVEETAEVLNVSPRTVKREWRMAKTWLRRMLT